MEEPIPSYYMAVLKIIQYMATMCNDLNRIPIFTREDYLYVTKSIMYTMGVNLPSINEKGALRTTRCSY